MAISKNRANLMCHKCDYMWVFEYDSGINWAKRRPSCPSCRAATQYISKSTHTSTSKETDKEVK